ERNEERRLYRNRATVRAEVPSAPLVEAPERVRPIAIEGEHPAPEMSVPVPAPIQGADEPPSDATVTYTAPFAFAEMPTSDLADVADFLPGYAPPQRTVSPEEQVQRMWKDPQAAAESVEIDDRAAGALWTPGPEREPGAAPSAPPPAVPERA